MGSCSGWLAGVAALALAGPAAAAPCSGFTDVDDADPFCTSVAWMKNRGITLGCTATQYCPSDFVTRLQMAAFMFRLGVQNAFLQGGNRFATTAIAGTLDGQPVELVAGSERVARFEPNGISPNLVGGHPQNAAAAGVRGATIGGGGAAPGSDTDVNNEGPNVAHDAYAVVGGGSNNIAGTANGVVTDAAFAVVVGGHLNRAAALGASVAGGVDNQATAQAASVAGGQANRASGLQAFVGGGAANVASGEASSVPGGRSNEAAGDYSVALGFHAEAGSNGCFVFSDASSANPTQCGVANAFVARAKGGFYLITGGTFPAYSGAHLAPGSAAWTTFSDRAAKANVVAVDAAAILDKVARLPIATWSWRAQDASIRHIGPMAQDFHAAFGLGETPLGISTVDADGVALAAIQGLYALLKEREAAIVRQGEALRRVQAELDELRAAVRRLHGAPRPR